MNFEERFNIIWNNVSNITLPEPTQDFCFYGQAFTCWADQLIKDLKPPKIVSINQAKVLLLDKFFEWYRYVPKAHRQKLGMHGHTCIFQVLVSAYEQLKVLELSLTPPLIFIPEPIQVPPPPQIEAIFLAEDLENK
jgi:hypothetical protein